MPFMCQQLRKNGTQEVLSCVKCFVPEFLLIVLYVNMLIL